MWCLVSHSLLLTSLHLSFLQHFSSLLAAQSLGKANGLSDQEVGLACGPACTFLAVPSHIAPPTKPSSGGRGRKRAGPELDVTYTGALLMQMDDVTDESGRVVQVRRSRLAV
jgi:hypothetical protein